MRRVPKPQKHGHEEDSIDVAVRQPQEGWVEPISGQQDDETRGQAVR